MASTVCPTISYDFLYLPIFSYSFLFFVNFCNIWYRKYMKRKITITKTWGPGPPGWGPHDPRKRRLLIFYVKFKIFTFSMLNSRFFIGQTSFCGEVGFGIWLKHHGKFFKHHGKIWNLTRRSGVWEKVRFQIFPWCLSQTPLQISWCLSQTPLQIFFCGVWLKHHGFWVEFGLNSEI